MWFLLLILFSNSPTAQSTYVDRHCGNDSSNLWLDIIFLVDNSKGMTDLGINKVASDITSLFDENIRFGNHSDPRSTRIALVVYNSDATVSFDLNAIKSFDDFFSLVFSALSSVSSVAESYIATGLNAAENLFATGRANNFRSNYKQMIILYASEFVGTGSNDPLPPALRLIEDGTAIVTVAFNQDTNNNLERLGEIASPGMNLTNDRNLISNIRGLMLQVNCFCPDLWTQYTSTFGDERALKYGVCLQQSSISASWMSAKIACQNMHQNAHLATEFNNAKHDYLFALMQNTTSSSISYHIGLNYVNGLWYWTQPNGSLLELDYYMPFWNPGYPYLTSTTTVAGNVERASGSVGWQNYNKYSNDQFYICETAACDTDNYCSQ